MKNRFSSYDIVCSTTELQKLIGMRVNNVYDIDNKTYLIRLQRSEEKSVLLLESGNRFHITNFEWPKNVSPSGFSMKMRKHLKNKRLESLTQMGTDRIVDLQFGTGEAAYHIILELYDRGNIVLTDHEMIILNVLRPHTEGDKTKFAVREIYPQNRARENTVSTLDNLRTILEGAKVGDPLKKVLMPHLDYGPALIEHVLLKHGFTNVSKIGKTFDITNDINELFVALQEAEVIMENAKKEPSKGYIIQKKEERPSTDPNVDKEYFYSNQEFHPFLFSQHSSQPFQEFDTFNLAVDEFYSTLEAQKIELRALHQEREAMKKLENIKKDHDTRLSALEKAQETDKQKAELITRNQQLVDDAILAIQSAVASQLSWTDIDTLVKDAIARGDPVATHIKQLKLETNHISLYLTDPYTDSDSEDSESDSENRKETLPPATVDIDLALSAFANARRYYDLKRSAAKKQQKTIESQGKALKSAEKKTKQTLKEVQAITNINKARKVYWFEKFFWFISSENYLIIAGRDQQQNELIVKRYMKANDIYVHADIHGASSIIIKNPSGLPVPPKTLNEAGTMAICYSVAWEAKVVTNAYWVLGEQVSKTAPTGEYLTTGSFMIRGKKNFLPPSHLILGLSFLFRLEDGYIDKHNGERKVVANDDAASLADSEMSRDEVEVEILDESDDNKDEAIDNPNELQHTSVNDDDVNKDNADCHIREGTEEGNDDNEELLKDKDNEEGSDSSDDDQKFPDTQIRIQHSEGTKIKVVAEPVVKFENKDENEEKIVYLGDNKPVVIKSKQKQKIKEGKAASQKNVIAPYNALNNYKFRVKLTPGTGRRGKAARTAVSMFLRDRTTTQREKDLLRAVKDEQLARNLPGKVKLSAPRLQALHK
ncbi:hypothetical protein ILUMI_11200 [Ignelater luminosus]|uniref:Nuclear export mediator factor NEMF homolog n=1 Tax=Ignelater luminosus TaxID=2038154 RepID=A0A8K0D2I9_IGNLU|nr:hypothetical protein ILUMI_11200 [Ignelater luminosus]